MPRTCNTQQVETNESELVVPVLLLMGVTYIPPAHQQLNCCHREQASVVKSRNSHKKGGMSQAAS